ncbi:MAG TPA: plastocyanin/azurin family copper-binding protein [Candidatus Polarisedimenticolia bacterium]|jgi:plastocyanin|nr:plastocyanin/azurin family copper-binding protein [Candidatus Polarisedimenticolia bacterium]
MKRRERAVVRRALIAAILVLAVPLVGRPVLPVEPGVDIAVPKVAVSTVTGTVLQFQPPRLVVEQADFARWNWTGGSHTTTSGSTCGVASGLWNSALNSTTTSFTRAFNEAPGTIPFFCSPHCGLGMTGQVVVTTPINLIVTASGSAAQLDWTGGGGVYRIYRSSSPLFTSGTTTVLTGATGTQALTFLDQNAPDPPAGGVNYYLVMNHF